MRFARTFRATLIASAIAGIAGFSSLVHAGVQDIFTPTGSTANGSPVSAEALFTTTTSSITLTLTNLTTPILNAGQLLSDIFFSLTGCGGCSITNSTGKGTIPESASFITVDSNGNKSAAAGFTNAWGFSNSGGTYHLDGLNATNTPNGLIITTQNDYASANGSIKGNPGHDTFADGSATFTFALTGATAAPTISDVVFSFGTETGHNVAVPIPAAVWLFGSGLLGLIGIARRRMGVTSAPTAA